MLCNLFRVRFAVRSLRSALLSPVTAQ